jgi:hypothetical protein
MSPHPRTRAPARIVRKVIRYMFFAISSLLLAQPLGASQI